MQFPKIKIQSKKQIKQNYSLSEREKPLKQLHRLFQSIDLENTRYNQFRQKPKVLQQMRLRNYKKKLNIILLNCNKDFSTNETNLNSIASQNNSLQLNPNQTIEPIQQEESNQKIDQEKLFFLTNRSDNSKYKLKKKISFLPENQIIINKEKASFLHQKSLLSQLEVQPIPSIRVLQDNPIEENPKRKLDISIEPDNTNLKIINQLTPKSIMKVEPRAISIHKIKQELLENIKTENSERLQQQLFLRTIPIIKLPEDDNLSNFNKNVQFNINQQDNPNQSPNKLFFDMKNSKRIAQDQFKKSQSYIPDFSPKNTENQIIFRKGKSFVSEMYAIQLNQSKLSGNEFSNLPSRKSSEEEESAKSIQNLQRITLNSQRQISFKLNDTTRSLNSNSRIDNDKQKLFTSRKQSILNKSNPPKIVLNQDEEKNENPTSSSVTQTNNQQTNNQQNSIQSSQNKSQSTNQIFENLNLNYENGLTENPEDLSQKNLSISKMNYLNPGSPKKLQIKFSSSMDEKDTDKSKSSKFRKSVVDFSQKWEYNPILYNQFYQKLQKKIQQKNNSVSPNRNRSNSLQLASFFLNNYQNFIRSIHLREKRTIFDLFAQSAELCQDLRLSLSFTKMILFIGEYYFDAHDYNKSSFYIRQAQMTAMMLNQYTQEIQAFLLLSRIAIRLKKYKYSLPLLKKALSLAWYDNNNEYELLIYELIGMTFYYQGYVKKAKIFHQKFMSGVIESPKSILRSNACQRMRFVEQMKECKSNILNEKIMKELSLPILNKFQRTFKDGLPSYDSCDLYKNFSIQTSTVKIIFRQLIQKIQQEENEINLNYIEEHIDYLDNKKHEHFKLIDQGKAKNFKELSSKIKSQKKERNPNLFYYYDLAPHTWIPSEIIDIKLRHIRQGQKHVSEDENLKNKLKLDTNEQIKLRKKKLKDFEIVMEDVQEKVFYNFNQLKAKEKWDQIYIKHLNNLDNHSLREKVYLQKYRTILDSIILDLY